MVKQVLQILFFFGLILTLSQCAQIVALNGGKRDTTPPKLLQVEPAANTLNFNSEVITLKFDEFVQIKDLNNELIVTPRLKTSPDISTDGRKIIVKLKKEELAPNTTYRIFFGEAIADMNESNSIPDFEYVFSTGAAIDTLKVKGEVTDAFNNKPVPEIMVGLYMIDKPADSLIYKKEPDYYTRTNASGQFMIKNLPDKTFSVYAFSDKNKNSLYDGESERAGFLGPDLKLGADSTIYLKLFQEEVTKSFIKKTLNPYFGFTQIILNKKSFVKLSTLNPELRNNIFETYKGREKDTISLYYRNTIDTLGLVLNNLSVEKTDTLKITLPRSNGGKRRLKSYTLNTIGNKLPLYDKLKLTFLNWMDTTRTDLSKITFSSKEDSLINVIPVKGRWQSVNIFEINHPLKEGVNYTLKIDTNAFFDLNKFTNDSLKINLTPQSKIEFGKLTLKLLLNRKQDYVVQLINEQDKVIKEEFISLALSSTNAVTIDFIDVAPAVYFLKIIYDDNRNKKWDTGNILKKQHAEKTIINSKQLKILSDWEIEEEIQIKD